MLLPEKISELAGYLAKGGEIEQAFALTEMLLTNFLDIETSYDTWRYGELLAKLFPVLVSHSNMETLELLCRRLSSILASSEKHNSLVARDSHQWRPAIEGHEQNSLRGLYEAENLLVSAVRDAAEQIIREEKALVQQVVTVLESQSLPIFHRITLHVLRTFTGDALDLIADYLSSRAEFDNFDSHHEYSLLVQECFTHLPLEAQSNILSWIEEGPNVENYKNGYKRWFGQEPTDELVASYMNHWRRDRLSFISSALPQEWKKRYERLITEYGLAEHPEFLSYMTEAAFVGSTSPKSAEEMKPMSVKDIISYLKNWKPLPSEGDNPIDPSPSREGLAQALTDIINTNPERFAEQARQFRHLHFTYINAILTGFEQAVKQKRTFHWLPVINLCSWVVTQRRKKSIPTNKVSDPEMSNSNWVWSCRIVLRLLLEGFQEGSTEIPLDLRSQVWIVLRPLTEDPEPTPEEEERQISSNMDLTALAINSVRGDAMHAVIRYALWVRKHTKNVPNGVRQARPGLNEISEVRRVLNKHLDPQHDSSLAIRSVYGQWFPWLVYLDLRWASQHISKIFPKEETGQRLRNAAWEAYIVYSSPFDNVLPVLAEEYHRAIDLIGTASSKRGHPYDPNEHLAEHLMVFYLRGKLVLDEPNGLLTQFFSKASDTLRGHALDFVGHHLFREKNTVPEQILARLQTLWEQRFKIVSSHTSHNTNTNELAAFGWWFGSQKFNRDWVLAQLEAVLQYNGRIEASHIVVEYLTKLSSAMPFPVLKCLGLLIESDRDEWRTSMWHEQIKEMLTHAHQSSDDNTRQEANKVAERLLAQGYPDYLVFIT